MLSGDRPNPDRYGYVRVDGILVGRVRPYKFSRRGDRFVVFREGDRSPNPMSFAGRNSIFASPEDAAQALVEVVRGQVSDRETTTEHAAGVVARARAEVDEPAYLPHDEFDHAEEGVPRARKP